MAEAATRPALSFVVPVFNEEANVGPLHAELTSVAHTIGRPYELVFVNDGSRDQTLPRLLALAAGDPHLRVVELDGNFGEAAAVSAGLNTARGEIVVTLDGDGQNDPGDTPRLLEVLEQGYDVVSGRRRHREEAFTTRVLPSLVANRLIVLATGVPVYDCGCGLKAYRRKVVAGAQLPRGFNRFLPAILGVDPKRVAEITVRDRPRGGGRSNYGLWRVAVVLRDLPSLPLVTRLRLPLGPLALGLAIAAVALGLAALGGMARQSWSAVSGALAAMLVVLAARHNVVRLAHARTAGVFRIRKVHDGTATTDRDRGRGVLGQEPPADLR